MGKIYVVIEMSHSTSNDRAVSVHVTLDEALVAWKTINEDQAQIVEMSDELITQAFQARFIPK